jgi:hypothetical protein
MRFVSKGVLVAPAAVWAFVSDDVPAIAMRMALDNRDSGRWVGD